MLGPPGDDGGMGSRNNDAPYKTGKLQKKGRHGGFKDRTFTLTRSALEYSTTAGVPKGTIMLKDIAGVEPGPEPGQLTVMTDRKTFLMQVPPQSTIRSNAQHEAALWAQAIDKLCRRPTGQGGNAAGSTATPAAQSTLDGGGDAASARRRSRTGRGLLGRQRRASSAGRDATRRQAIAAKKRLSADEIIAAFVPLPVSASSTPASPNTGSQFDAQAHVASFLRQHDPVAPDVCEAYCEELLEYKAVMARQLQAEVYDNYRGFIGASSAMVAMETSVEDLRHMLRASATGMEALHDLYLRRRARGAKGAKGVSAGASSAADGVNDGADAGIGANSGPEGASTSTAAKRCSEFEPPPKFSVSATASNDAGLPGHETADIIQLRELADKLEGALLTRDFERAVALVLQFGSMRTRLGSEDDVDGDLSDAMSRALAQIQPLHASLASRLVEAVRERTSDAIALVNTDSWRLHPGGDANSGALAIDAAITWHTSRLQRAACSKVQLLLKLGLGRTAVETILDAWGAVVNKILRAAETSGPVSQGADEAARVCGAFFGTLRGACRSCMSLLSVDDKKVSDASKQAIAIAPSLLSVIITWLHKQQSRFSGMLDTLVWEPATRNVSLALPRIWLPALFDAAAGLDVEGLSLGFGINAAVVSRMERVLGAVGATQSSGAPEKGRRENERGCGWFGRTQRSCLLAVDEEKWQLQLLRFTNNHDIHIETATPRSVRAPASASTTKPERTVRLTTSAVVLYRAVAHLMREVGPVLEHRFAAAAGLYDVLVRGVTKLVEAFVMRLTVEVANKQSQRRQQSAQVGAETGTRASAGASRGNSTATSAALNDSQRLALLADVRTVGAELLPRVESVWRQRFERPVSPLQKLSAKLRSVFGAFRDNFCQQWSSRFAQELRWSDAEYERAEVADELRESPSKGVCGVMQSLTGLRQLLKEAFFADQRAKVLNAVVEGLFRALLDEKKFWLHFTSRASLTLGRGGLHRMILDIRFLAAAAQPFVSEDAASAAKTFEQKAVSVFVGASGEMQNIPEGLLMPDDWFALPATPQMNLALSSDDADANAGAGATGTDEVHNKTTMHNTAGE